MNNEQIWKSTDRKRRSKLPKNIRIMATGLTKAIQPIIDSIQNYTSPEDMASDAPEKFDDRYLEQAYRELYLNTAPQFAMERYDEIVEKYAPTDYIRKQDDTLEDIWQENIQRYIQTGEIADRIVQVTNTTKERVRGIIQKGIDEGLSIPDIASDIEKLGLDNVIRNRGTVVARTETINASNKGTMMGADATNLELEKVWIPTADGRVRQPPESAFDHNISEVVDQGKPFVKTGEELDYPGDPKGSAGNVVQCRCAVAHQKKEV